MRPGVSNVAKLPAPQVAADIALLEFLHPWLLDSINAFPLNRPTIWRGNSFQYASSCALKNAPGDNHCIDRPLLRRRFHSATVDNRVDGLVHGNFR